MAEKYSKLIFITPKESKDYEEELKRILKDKKKRARPKPK